jgi:hypothetical protein
MVKTMFKQTVPSEVGMPAIMKEAAKLQAEIARLSDRYEALKKRVFPVAEWYGDVYEADGIEAKIVRGKTWKVNPIRLLGKFGELAHPILTVSSSGFRKMFDAGQLGTKTDLRGIARLVKEKPKLYIRQK